MRPELGRSCGISARLVPSALSHAAVRRATATATVAGLLVAAALLVTRLVFFTVAVYRALGNALGDVPALLLIGSGCLVASLIALLIVQFKRR